LNERVEAAVRESRLRGAGLLGLLVLAPAHAPSAQAVGEPVCLVPMLRNGGFGEPPTPGLAGIPWWVEVGAGGTVTAGPDGSELYLEGDSASVYQDVPAFGPLVGQVVLRGRMRGSGEMVLYGGGTAAKRFDTRDDVPLDFEYVIGEAPQLQGELRPPLKVQIAGAELDGVPMRSWWSRLEVLTPLPCPGEAALRAEILAHLARYVATVLETCLDDVGPRATPFRAFGFDAETGARMQPAARVGDVAFHELLLRAWRATAGTGAAADARAGWAAALTAFVDAYLELCIHPATGLARRWDPLADAPVDDAPVEIHRALAFLLDVAEDGPEPLRARCLAAAERMARAVLAHGVLPDGEVAASYYPADGAPNFEVDRLRRLDVPAQLARLARATADAALGASCLDAAEQACLTLAYDHYWPGDWANVDPGFDDNFGHYGARAAVMWRAHPDGAVFRALAMSGWRRYAPLWRDTLRYGGNVAADQVRCWRIAATIAELAPETRADVAELLEAAAHAHFQGQQIAGGTWIDTTVKRFSPVHLPVGDTSGVPQNLLAGLGIVYGARDLGLARDDVRAMFTAVLRATDAEFGRAHGFSAVRGAPSVTPGSPGFAGSTGVAVGLVEMLEALAE
jgi:hypothetical protein